MESSNILNELFPQEIDRLPVQTVPVNSLVVGDSPRLSGLDSRHAASLAEAMDKLPPILVERSTMRVIDGAHRLRAAQLRGDSQIEVRLVDGDSAAYFVLSVIANARHGRPLTLADKKAAAARIVESFPHWSDRAIATAVSLDHKTVKKVRDRSGGENHQPNDRRVGRDGRSRLIDSRHACERAAEMIAENPDTPVRHIAEKTGISPATVLGIRHRLVDGNPAVSDQARSDAEKDKDACGRSPAQKTGIVANLPIPPRGESPTWETLRRDPAFRLRKTARSLLQMLSVYSVLERHSQEIIAEIPTYALIRVAHAAREVGRAWLDFANLAEKLHTSSGAASGKRAVSS